jgi:hypothetical protein
MANRRDLTERNLDAQKKRNLEMKDALINRAGSLDHRMSNLSDLVDNLIRRVTALEIKVGRG